MNEPVPDEPSGPFRNHHTDWESWPTKGPDDLEDGVNKIVEDMKVIVAALRVMQLEDIFEFIKKNVGKLSSHERVEILSNILDESGFNRNKQEFIRLTVKNVLEGRPQFHNLSRMAIFICTKMILKGELTDERLHTYFWVHGKEFKEREDLDTFKELLEAINCNKEVIDRIAKILEQYYSILPTGTVVGAEVQVYPYIQNRLSRNAQPHSLNATLQLLEKTVASLERFRLHRHALR